LSALRTSVQVVGKLQKLPMIPDAPLRELLTKLKKRDNEIIAQISEIRRHLDDACAFLKPPD